MTGAQDIRRSKGPIGAICGQSSRNRPKGSAIGNNAQKRPKSKLAHRIGKLSWHQISSLAL